MKTINNDMRLKRLTMNLSKKCRHITSICILAALLLSGCNLLPEESKETAIKDAEEYEVEKQLGEYKQQIDEMLAMRDGLNRLIELEADLTYLLDEMGRFEEQNPNLEFAQVNFDEKEKAQNNEVVYSAGGVSNKSQLGSLNPLKFSAPGNLESRGLGSFQAKEQKVLGNKRFSEKEVLFSSPKLSEVTTTAAQKLNAALAQPQPEHVNNDKFSTGDRSPSQLPMSIVSEFANCNSIKTDKFNSFAVHLASYGSLKSAIEAWKRIRAEYGNELCSDIAKTQIVIVKGKTYHRLNVGGYVDKRIAQEVCIKLQNRSVYCKAVEFEGDMI